MRQRTVTKKNWPTQEQDMRAAEAIVEKYRDLDDVDEPLGMIEVTLDNTSNEPISIEMSDWMIEVIEFFRKKYGAQKGQAIATKVMTRFLLKGEILH